MYDVILAVGGTGGHILPAKKLASELSEYNVAYAGVNIHKHALFEGEKNLRSILGDTLSIKVSLSTLFKGCKIIAGVVQACRFLFIHKPKVVVGFGSYHSFPILIAAKVLKIPIILYEPNAILGRVNRFFLPTCHAIGMLFPIENKKAQAISIPASISDCTRDEALEYFGLKPNKKTILVFGGSQGAKAINALFCSLADNLSYQIIHLIGSRESKEKIEAIYQKENVPCCVKKFEENMEMAYKSANFVVCRAGASTISELIAYALPALLIPYPSAKDQHQLRNAHFFSDTIRGGITIEEKDIDENTVRKAFGELIENNEQFIAAISAYKGRICKRTFTDLIKEQLGQL